MPASECWQKQSSIEEVCHHEEKTMKYENNLLDVRDSVEVLRLWRS